MTSRSPLPHLAWAALMVLAFPACMNDEPDSDADAGTGGVLGGEGGTTGSGGDGDGASGGTGASGDFDGGADAATAEDAALPSGDATPSSDATQPRPDAAPDAAPGSTDAATDGGASGGFDGGVDAAVEAPDLKFLVNEVAPSVWFDEIVFDEDSCAWIEGCVSGTGPRRLLRFDVVTANVGTADMVMGDPTDNVDLFEYSECHDHYHFSGYARYELLDGGGEVVAPGHKQAFCLLDSERFEGMADDETVRDRGRYNCEFQGISRGWQDNYHSGLDCQWLDVTDVAPGDYDIAVFINEGEEIAELSYANNSGVARVSVPPPGMDAPCADWARTGTRRHCGWRQAHVERCERNEIVRVGCGACEHGQAEGDPMMRVCAGDGVECSPSGSLARSDDACRSRNPFVEFDCPPEGVFTTWVAGADHREAWACEPAVTREVLPPPTSACEDGGEPGLARACGWEVGLSRARCVRGWRYRAGCNAEPACSAGEGCDGDPMMRVCSGGPDCQQGTALAQSDDACEAFCPSTDFECPAEGEVSVLVAPYRVENEMACPVGLVRLGEGPDPDPLPEDGGVPDAGSAVDTGVMVDARVVADTGVARDAGPAPDAARPDAAAPVPDAGAR
jgi:hypothetical protein